MAEPREALQVRVDDETDKRDRPQPADDRVELEARDQVHARVRARRTQSPATRESMPAGSSRPAVRGLRASISASINLLSPIASERAPTIARVIHKRSCPDGTSCTARNAPMYANGSAKTVCSIFTSDAKRRGRASVELTSARARWGSPASSSSACGKRGLDQREAVTTAAGRPGEVDDQRRSRECRRHRDRADRAVSSRLHPRAALPRFRARAGRGLTRSPRA